MTAFNEQERSMMWGIYGELETMNRSLTRLVELLECQEQERKDAKPTNPIAEDSLRRISELARVKATRRANGWCLLCGATRKGAGEGCYEVEGVMAHRTWVAHSWPEDESL